MRAPFHFAESNQIWQTLNGTKNSGNFLNTCESVESNGHQRIGVDVRRIIFTGKSELAPSASILFT